MTTDAENIELAIAEQLNQDDLVGDDHAPIIEIPETTVEAEPEVTAVQEPEPASETVEEVIQPEVKKEAPEETNKAKRVQQNTQLTDAYSSPTEWVPDADTVVLPSDFDRQTQEALSGMANVDLMSDPVTREWASTVSEGLSNSTYNETFVSTLEDQKAHFGQYIDFNGAKLAGGRPRWKTSDNLSLKGERSTILLMSHLGYGTLFQVPLWHTGIWITFKAPTESEIIELNRIIASDKTELGRYSYGVAFSNISSYMTDRLTDFALQHVYDTTMRREDIPEGGLKSIILPQDYPSLLWGLVCSMYPRGFQYSRGCVADPEKCNHTIQELLNIAKLQWVNRSALTDWQLNHMSSRQAKSKDAASVRHYQEEMVSIQKRVVKFNEGTEREIRMTLRSPTLAEYIDAGHRWIGDIVNLVDRTLGMDASDVERDNYIKRHGQSSSMRQYIHWVESIELGTNIIDERESIEQNFNVLSADDYIREAFMEYVIDYINSSSVAVIGIPTFDCPKCGGEQPSQLSGTVYKNVIPLDVVQLFFALITQRLSKIARR